MTDRNRTIDRGNAHRRILGGMVAHALGHVLDIGTQLALVPLFLATWGDRKYGDWLALTSFTTFFTLGAVGFATATATEMTFAYAKREDERHSQVFRSGLGLLGVVAVALVILVGLATWIVDINRWMNVTTLSPLECKVIVWLFFFRFLEYQCRSFLAATFHSILKFARGRMWFNGSSAALFLSTSGALLVNGDPIVVGAAGLCSLMVVLVAMAVDVKLHLPSLCLTPSVPRPNGDTSALLKQSLAAAAVPTSLAIRQHASVLITQLLLGPAAVTLLSISRLLTGTIVQITRLPQHGALAEMSTAFGRGDLSLVRDLSSALVKTALGVGGVLAVIVLALGAPFLHWWTNGKVTADWWLLLWMCVSAVLQSIWNANIVILLARNLQSSASAVLLIAAALSIPVGFAFGELSGVEGIGFALATVDALICLVIAPLAVRQCVNVNLPTSSQLT